MNQKPILYSFRRCPYAIRARMGLVYANIRCELREVVLRDKPQEMLELSPKATVPVLHLPDGQVIDESYDIIKWALEQNDPDDWQKTIEKAAPLVEENDGTFKSALDKYKYASRFPAQKPEAYRQQGEVFLQKLELILTDQPYLSGDKQAIADIAILPFIRQFAHVDQQWFFSTPYPHLQNWLEHSLKSSRFKNVMKKYPQWHPGDDVTYFPE